MGNIPADYLLVSEPSNGSDLIARGHPAQLGTRQCVQHLVCVGAGPGLPQDCRPGWRSSQGLRVGEGNSSGTFLWTKWPCFSLFYAEVGWLGCWYSAVMIINCVMLMSVSTCGVSHLMKGSCNHIIINHAMIYAASTSGGAGWGTVFLFLRVTQGLVCVHGMPTILCAR